MSLFRKIWMQLVGAAHDGVDAVSDEGRAARQTVRQIEAAINEAKQGLVDVEREKILLERQYEKAAEEADAWLNRAKEAIANDRDDLASAALEKEKEYRSQANGLGKQLETIRQSYAALQARIDDLTANKGVMKSNAAVITARTHVASATARTAEVLERIGGEDFDGSIDSLNATLDRKEAEALARLKSVTQSGEKNLAEEIDSLSKGDSSTASRLAALKAEMGKI